MFLLLGVGEGDQDLNLHQPITCPVCGKKAHLEAYFHYTSFNVFFVPAYKYQKQYYAVTSCCGATCPITEQQGKNIYWGQIEALPLKSLALGATTGFKACKHCGFDTMEPYQYCPVCGKPLGGAAQPKIIAKK
ncbi:MAG: zinc ribbon domain-containing protein [Faecalibacterium sp.]